LNDQAELDLDDFEKCMHKHQPKVVAVTHIPTNSGKIQDVESIGRICEKFDTIYLVDACQSIGQLPIDVHNIKCDFLSGTGRKFLRGPRGTGILFVSDKMLNQEMAPLMVDMRGAEWIDGDRYKLFPGARRFEMWEFSYSHLLGLSAAIQYANEIGLGNIEKYNQMLCHHFREGLQKVDGVHLYDEGSKLGSLITFRKDGISQQHTRVHLAEHQVYFSLTTRKSAHFDFGRKGIDWAVRLSPHYFNTIEETDELVNVISRM
jgi:selenocysteine lyase/cysteine desulfurase